MARKKVSTGVDENTGGVSTVSRDENDFVRTHEVPVWFPTEMPEDEGGLIKLAQQIEREVLVAEVPRGAILFSKTVRQLVHRKPLYEQAQNKISQLWAYMHGEPSPGSLKGARKRSVKSRAMRFYETLSEDALQRHCAMHELDYDALRAEGRVIEALVEVTEKSL